MPGVVSSQAIPTPEQFATWQEWVKDFTTSVLNQEAQNPFPQAPSIAVARLPSAAQVGLMAYVPNEIGGTTLAFSDGTNWRRVQDRAIVA